LPKTSEPRLLSFTLDGWTVLGGGVSVSLSDRVAVLVGRNGAGKSAILEGFRAISSWAIDRFGRSAQFDIDSIPRVLDTEILTPNDRRLHYRYELIALPTSADDQDIAIEESSVEDSEETQFSWNERCQYIDGDQEVLWTTKIGVTTFSEGNATILGSTSSLRRARFSIADSPHLRKTEEMHWVSSVLSGVRLLGKTSIRQTYIRRPSLIQVSRTSFSSSSRLFWEVDRLSRKILRMKGEERDELESICQRIGIGSKITIQKFVSSEEPKEKAGGETEEFIASILLDEVNIGLLSDGTLRVLSLLTELIAAPPSATTIIEEPETQIHPGMLAKLLNEIEAYTSDENLIISTHSPQVVAWTKPENINLVYRDRGCTTVRKLHSDEIEQVVDYLCDEGDLGDWLYSGILDG
jgi:AAA domain, putative AbiEii toxin, Type IV TA system